jgi:hypothetical protein
MADHTQCHVANDETFTTNDCSSAKMFLLLQYMINVRNQYRSEVIHLPPQHNDAIVVSDFHAVNSNQDMRPLLTNKGIELNTPSRLIRRNRLI